jgi:hypothetical protein
MPNVLSDPNRREVREEGNLLIEAVSLLVQRQRETESWIAEQIWQAEERATASERLYAEFEARLAGIEEHLARLVDDVEPLHDDAGVDERLERLREQVEGLKSGPESRSARTPPVLAAPPTAVQSTATEAPGREPEAFSSSVTGRPVTREVRYSPERRGRSARPARPPVATGQGVSFWTLLGAGPAERFGLVLIGAGAVAVVYAVLTQLRF